ncbi:MAG: hypothetical protein M1828_001223 [Chrysothrix sp. TS-e1954]|nr:MAG: hypothetical protein M1828_001223 [Chrysothrix sp. TS-e1954]
MSASSSRSIFRCSECACRHLRRRISPPTYPPPSSVSRHQPTTSSRRWASSSSAATAAPSNPKVAEIVDQISGLTLLETADLVSTLKTRLNIPDMPTFAPSAVSGGGGAAAAAAAPAEEEEDTGPKYQEKTLFNIKLQSIDASAKPKIIKEVKAMLGLSLVDSKKFVESVPKVMKENAPKEECEKIIETMKGLGGVAVME